MKPFYFVPLQFSDYLHLLLRCYADVVVDPSQFWPTSEVTFSPLE